MAMDEMFLLSDSLTPLSICLWLIGTGTVFPFPQPSASLLNVNRSDWVTSYKVMVSNDSHTWVMLKNGSKDLVSISVLMHLHRNDTSLISSQDFKVKVVIFVSMWRKASHVLSELSGAGKWISSSEQIMVEADDLSVCILHLMSWERL